MRIEFYFDNSVERYRAEKGSGDSRIILVDGIVDDAVRRKHPAEYAKFTNPVIPKTKKPARKIFKKAKSGEKKK